VTDYAAATARPLFASDRRAHPFFLDADGQASAGMVRLTGVLMAPGTELATLTTDQGQSLRLRLGGEPVAGWQLLSLEPRSAVVSGPAGTLQLELQVFNGGEHKAADAAPSGVPPAAAAPGDAADPAAADSAAGTPIPSDAQIKSIRDRIQARRKQAQQHPNGSSGAQNP
jgi:general secretion pathway protein N